MLKHCRRARSRRRISKAAGAASDGPGRSRSSPAILLTVICVLMVFPFLWAALSVTKPTDVAFANPPVFATADLQAYVDLWQTTYFYLYLTNTLIVAVICTVVALLIGLPAAYALSRFGGLTSTVLLVLALIFRALPRFAVVLPMYDISRALGIYDTTYAMAIALVAINQPFTIWLLRNFFAEIPRELDEAAMIDGCTRIGMLRTRDDPADGPGHPDRRHLRVPVRLPGVPDRGGAHRHRRRRRCRCSSPPSSVRPCRCCSRRPRPCC